MKWIALWLSLVPALAGAQMIEVGEAAPAFALPALSEEFVGRLIYFFEHAVAVGGYLLGVNPFDQPGVEAYKRQMFSRLGKPGA